MKFRHMIICSDCWNKFTPEEFEKHECKPTGVPMKLTDEQVMAELTPDEIRLWNHAQRCKAHIEAYLTPAQQIKEFPEGPLAYVTIEQLRKYASLRIQSEERRKLLEKAQLVLILAQKHIQPMDDFIGKESTTIKNINALLSKIKQAAVKE